MKAKWRNLLFGGPGSASAVGDLGLLVLRVGVGLMMAIGHGKSKMFGAGGFGPPAQLVEGVEALGFPGFFAWLVALAEFGGGILLALGLLTRPAALALSFNMAVAAFMAHGKHPWFMSGTGPAKEPALLYLVPFIAVMLMGAGRYSLDRLVSRRTTK